MTDYPVRPVEVSAHIPAPAAEVLAFVADSRNDPLWCPNVETVELIDGAGIAVGTRFRFHQHLDRPGGERMQFDVDLEITAIGHSSISWLANDKLQTREITLTVEPEGDGARITQVTKPTFHRRPGLVRWVYPRLAGGRLPGSSSISQLASETRGRRAARFGSWSTKPPKRQHGPPLLRSISREWCGIAGSARSRAG